MSLAINLSIFKHNRNFAFLYIGQFASFLGTMMTGIALPYQIYHQTQSTMMVGLLSLVQLLPVLVTALLGGVLADRYHRRRLLLAAECILMFGAGLLALNASLTHPGILALFVIAGIMSAFNGLHRPALDSIVQQIVAKEDLPAVGSLGTFKTSVCMIAGPALGGLLIASKGLLFTYLIDIASFAVSLVALLVLRAIPAPIVKRQESVMTSIKQGFRYAASRQELFGTYAIDFTAMIFGMPMALFPAIAVQFGSAKVLGLLYAAPAIGALLVSFFSGWTARVKRHGAAVAIAAFFWGVAIIAFGLAPNIQLAVLFLACAGAADAISGIFRLILWNETVPNDLRGRLAGIEMIGYLSGPKLGDAEAGLMAAAFGVTVSVVSGGVMCLIGVGSCCYFLPKFWHYRADEHQAKNYDNIEPVAQT